MRPVQKNDRQSELSYAYLHAVASYAGAGCKVATRLDDNRGIDAELCAWLEPQEDGGLEEIDLKIQLKSTRKAKVKVRDKFSFRINSVAQYDNLRNDSVGTARLLVVLFLPEQEDEWLAVSPASLILRDCAYWVSLRGAPPAKNDTGQTVYLPERQIFNPDNLKEIFSRLSRLEKINYL